MTQEAPMKSKQILASFDHIPDSTDYPNVDGIILKDVLKYSLDKEGRLTFYRYQLKRILKDFERDRRSDAQIMFNQRLQQVNVLTARSIMRDGQTVDTPEYGLNQITPAALQKAPYFTEFQSKVVSLVGIEVGGFTELEYEIIDQKAFRSLLYGTIPIQLHIPVLSREIIFELPDTRPLSFSAVVLAGKKIKPESVVKDGIQRTSWQLEHIPHWDDEDNHNLATADCAKLFFSEHGSWSDMSRYFNQIINAASVRDEHLEKRVTELLKDIECPVQKCIRLNKHITNACTTVDFDHLNNFHQVRSARDVLACGYGTTLEKAIVVAEMIRAAGLEADVTLACPLPAMPADTFHLGIFPEVWVHVRPLEMYMRPDKVLAEARREHLEGRTLLVVNRKGQEQTPLTLNDAGPGAGNRCDIKVKLALKKDATIEGTIAATLAGTYNPYYALAQEETDKVIDWVKGFTKKCWPGAELEKHHFQLFAPTHSALSINFSQKKLEKNRDNRFDFTLPAFLTTFLGLKIPHQYVTRSSTYELPGTLLQNVSWTIELPEDFEILMLPAHTTRATEGTSFEQKCELKEEKGKPASLTCSHTFKVSNRFVKPDQYPGFRTMVLEDLRPHGRMLFLKQK